MTNVTSYTVTLDALAKEVYALSGELRVNQNFLGVISVNATTTRTPFQIENDTLELQAYHERIYSNANTTWASIQNYTDVITSSNGSAKLLQVRVNEALNELSLARRDRVAAEMIVNGSFSIQFQNNTDILNSIKLQEDSFASMITFAQNQLSQAETLARTANVTANEAEAIRAAKAGDIEVQLVAAQITKFNSTQAQAAGLGAQQYVNTYLV